MALDSAPVDQLPCVARAPLQPPEAVHPLALSESQLRFEMPPTATVVGDAFSATVVVAEVTTTSADCEVLPPGPVQVSV